ncbi:hypothetical protein [Kutzneria chonburiensis]|uniref:Ornithine cyclodeaminase n=1 Tax=Kutzneria chonburiensis TaxID=1483604 RepID=A0ABV6N6G9_9PSEU|nr:hypothetical protein [Kutzneria chonburiensis]
MRLSAEDLRDALDCVDPVEMLIRATDSAATLTHYDTDLVLLDDPGCGLRCVLPETSLRDAYAASMAALAARLLIAPGVAITCVLGGSRLHLSVLARNVKAISHIAVCAGDIDTRLTEYLDLTGIGYSTTTDFHEAARGANLILLTEPAPAFRPCESAVLINATGQPLAALAVDRVVTEDDLPGLVAGEYPGRITRADTVLVELHGRGRLSPQLAADLYWAALASRPTTTAHR